MMEIKRVICTLFLVCIVAGQTIFSQSELPRYRIKGQLTDALSGKPLKRFPVTVKEFKRTIKADSNGEFLLNMVQGSYTFVLDDYPFEKREVFIHLTADTIVEFALETMEGVRLLEEVEVVGAKPLTAHTAGVSKVMARELASLPAMIGERDLIRALSLTAGVTSSNEGTADMQVRGGTHGQNLFLLDNIPLYSTQHMFGMVSAFNPTIIKSADLYKAAFPAYYGGRIASVLDVKSKDADLSRFWGEGEISLLASKAALNIPLVKNKLGLTIAGRISNYSLLNIISGVMEDTKLALHFADINANLIYLPTEKDRLKLTFMHNSDGININQYDSGENTTGWLGNRQQNIGFNWRHTFSENTENNLHLYADGYWFSFKNEVIQVKSKERNLFDIRTNIRSLGIEDKVSHRFSEKLKGDAGASLHMYVFSPFTMRTTDTAYLSQDNSVLRLGTNLFAQAGYTFLPNQTLDIGARFSLFGNGEILLPSFEPRIGYHGMFKNNISVSASASRMTQHIHRVANPGLGITMELFQPSGTHLKPEEAWVYSLGGAKDFRYEKMSLSVKADMWYKHMRNLVEFTDGYDMTSVIWQRRNLPDQTSGFLTQGIGRAYGIDLSGNMMFKRYKFTADYTWMHARNKFDELNNGNWFNATTDIRHSLSLTGELKMGKGWSFSAAWQYRSGRPITLPTAIFVEPNIDFGDGSIEFYHGTSSGWYYRPTSFHPIETERNNARMRSFHKLDIAFNRTFISKKKLETNLSLGIYNVYNRANPSYYFIGSKNVDGINYPVLKSISIFPILPSFTWGIKF